MSNIHKRWDTENAEMTLTVKEKRDLSADLAICDAATPGLLTVDDRIDYAYVRCNNVVYAESAPDFARFIAEARAGWPEAIQRAMTAEADADFLADRAYYFEMKDAYNEERIESLEAEVERLRAVLERIGSATTSQFVDIPHMVAELKMTANRALRTR